MTNQIEIEDIKLWIGELYVENKLLHKEVARLRNELEKLKEKLKTTDDD